MSFRTFDFFETAEQLLVISILVILSLKTLSNVKNITVTDEMYICDEMLGYYSLDKGSSKFKPEASEMLTDFFKNNKVDPKICKFIPSDNNNTKSQSGNIHFDEKANIWRFKGDK